MVSSSHHFSDHLKGRRGLAGGVPLLLASVVYRVVNSTSLDLQAGVQVPGSSRVGELSRRQTGN